MKLVLLCLSGALLMGCVSCDAKEEPPPPEESVHARQHWIQLDKTFRSTMSKVVRKALPTVMKEVYKKDISSRCLSALLHLTSGLKQTKAWTFKMLDSSGRFPEGFLSGTLASLGNYDECVNIRVNETKVQMRGQYCVVNILPQIPSWKPYTSLHGVVPELQNVSTPDSVVTFLMGLLHNLHVTSIKVGICSPSMCTADDINRLVQIIPEQAGLDWKFEVKHCETLESVHFTPSQLVALYALGVLVLLLVIGTIVNTWCSPEDLAQKGAKSAIFRVFRSFSVMENARKLSDFTCPQEKLGFAYGMIFIVFYWVCISNTFMYVNYDVAANLLKAFELVQGVFYEIVLNRVIPLQVLFFLGGLMTTYRWLNCSEESLNVFKFLLKRYWRFTPAYALVLALVIVTPTWGSGPTWSSHMEPMYQNCKDNWWYNILYINNYIDPDKVCLDHTWVFAVDAQLHVMAVFILIPLKMRPKIGLMLTFVLAVAGLASIALTNVYYDLPPNEALAFLHERDREFYAEHSYYRMYTHVPLYCCGVFVAYLMTHHPNLKIPKKLCFLAWILSGIGILAALTVVHEWRSGILPSPLLGAIYASMSKVAQGAFLSWVSVACMTGSAGTLRDVLSWRPFAFFARLLFMAYAMHVPIINMVQGFKKEHMYVADFELFYIVLNHVAGTFIIAYILHVCFEAPFISLGDMIRKRYKGRTLEQEEPMTEKPSKPPPSNSWNQKSHC